MESLESKPKAGLANVELGLFMGEPGEHCLYGGSLICIVYGALWGELRFVRWILGLKREDDCWAGASGSRLVWYSGITDVLGTIIFLV